MLKRPVPPKTAPLQAARDARLLARAATSGALATLRRAARGNPQPYVSKVGVALDADGSALFLFSTLAAHTQDLLAAPRCSLLVEAPGEDENPLTAARATLVGGAVRLDGDEALAAREIYLARHPSAARYADFGDFAFWRLTVDKVHYVGGFGMAKWTKGTQYRLNSRDFLESRGRLLNELNGPKNTNLKAAMGLKRSYQAVDVDPDGALICDAKGAMLRLNFPSPAKDLRAWRARFAALVKRSRA